MEKDYFKVILEPERSIDTEQLCAELRKIALMKCCGGSNSVDQIEWKAASVIQQLLRERECF